MNASADTTKSERPSEGFNKHEKERLLMGFNGFLPDEFRKVGKFKFEAPQRQEENFALISFHRENERLTPFVSVNTMYVLYPCSKGGDSSEEYESPYLTHGPPPRILLR